jgi:hypothetical protein
MKLLELTPAEIDFLTTPPVVPNGLQTRLTLRLAATLTARLRMPVQMIEQAQAAPANLPATPQWLPDGGLATLWLTRRLGGQQFISANTSFVPPTLIHTLDNALAECWLDAPAQTVLPPVLAWRLTCHLTRATLAVQLPPHITDMTRWARGVIRHA